jgi:hypothetical protein
MCLYWINYTPKSPTIQFVKVKSQNLHKKNDDDIIQVVCIKRPYRLTGKIFEKSHIIRRK